MDSHFKIFYVNFTKIRTTGTWLDYFPVNKMLAI